MADQQILSIDLDTSQFDAFKAKFDNFQAEAKVAPDPFARAASSLHDAGDAISVLSSQFGALAKSASASSMTGNSSFISRWSKGSHDASKDWAATAKSIGTSKKDLISFDKVWRNVKSFGKDASIIGGALAAGFVTAERAASNLAKRNLEARSVGLPIGRQQAFEADYGPLGFGKETINAFADAKEDPTQWRGLIGAGVSPDRIKSEAPDELAIDAAQRMSKMYGQWETAGKNAKQLAEAFHFTDFFSTSQLRAGASWSQDQWNQTHDKYVTDARDMAVSQGAADDATRFKQTWASDVQKLSNAFDAAIGNATPELSHLADAATAAGLNLIKWFGPKVAKLADQSAEVLDDLSGQPKPAPADGKYPHSIDGGLRKLGDGLRSIFPGIPDTMTPGNTPLPSQLKVDPRVDSATLAAYKRLSSAAEKKYDLPAGLQALQMSIESRFIKNAVNPDSGATGLLQFMPSTARGMGIDPTDPAQSIDAGGALLRQMTNQYGSLGKGLAAFDGDSHITRDSRKFDSWLQGAKSETLNYLRPFQDSGYDLGLNPTEIAYLKAHSREFSAAPNDANLKTSAATLDSNESFDNGRPSATPPNPKKAVEDHVRGVTDSMESWASKTFRAGGGEQFARPGKNTTATPSQLVPTRVDVRVSTPAGSSANVSVNSIPQ